METGMIAMHVLKQAAEGSEEHREILFRALVEMMRDYKEGRIAKPRPN